MNKLEEQIQRFLEKNGWIVMRKGWPDFLCTRESHLGESVLAIEVKSSIDQLKKEQIIVHKILKKAGLPVYIIRPEHLKKKKQLYGTLIWSSKDYKTYKYTIERLNNELKIQSEKLNNLEKQLNELSIIFDESETDGKDHSTIQG